MHVKSLSKINYKPVVFGIGAYTPGILILCYMNTVTDVRSGSPTCSNSKTVIKNNTVKSVLNDQSKIDKTKALKTNGSLKRLDL